MAEIPEVDYGKLFLTGKRTLSVFEPQQIKQVTEKTNTQE